jgi:hypothetical protein
MHFLRIGLSVMHLLRCDMPTGSGINAILYDITHSTETETLRERIAEITVQCLPATDEPSRQLVDKLVDLHCALQRRTRNPQMINDISIGGVFFPGLLMTVHIALICTLSLFNFNQTGFYRRLPFLPLIDFSTFIISCFLLCRA